MSVYSFIRILALMLIDVIWWFLTIPLDKYGNTPLTLIVVLLPLFIIWELSVSGSNGKQRGITNNTNESKGSDNK